MTLPSGKTGPTPTCPECGQTMVPDPTYWWLCPDPAHKKYVPEWPTNPVSTRSPFGI